MSSEGSALSFAAYARWFLAVLLGGVLGLAGLNLLIDPYAVRSEGGVEGINARKTRTAEDGRRVYVSHAIARRPEQTILLGSSRTVDGFPEAVDDWPGGLFNAGMRGTNAFELSHAAVMAGERADLRCLVIGLDLGEFAASEKFKPAFPVSALPDGNRLLSAARAALSPNTAARSIQTVIDNISGRDAPAPFSQTYPPGVQRARFEGAPAGTLDYFRRLRIDPARVDFLFEALDALAEEGVQVIGFIHPVHAWYEEAMFAAGKQDDYFALREDLARRFAALSAEAALNPCIEGEGGAALFDFSGFQAVSTTPLPGPQQTQTHPWFHEPAHYLPAVGEAMLARMQGEAAGGVFAETFGVRLTPETAAPSAEAVRARRAAYLQTAEGAALAAKLDAAAARPWPAPEARAAITRQERRRYQRRMEALAEVERDAS